ncbi:MAG: transposase [bacterium]|nr:transposase [bacterium]
MRVVGLDVSSDAFHACVYNAQGVVASRRFELHPHWQQEFAQWCARRGVQPQSDWVVVENTGVYSAQVCYPLHQAGFRVALVNAWQVRQGFRWSKTDVLDAARLAEYGYRFADTLRVWQPRAERVEQVHQRLVERLHYLSVVQQLEGVLCSLRLHPVRSEGVLARLEASVSSLRSQIALVEEEIRGLIAEEDRLREGCAIVRSVPGCGEVLSWWMLDLTDGFVRSVDGRTLSSYFGHAPHARLSGRRVRGGSHSRGYGPEEVRRVLHMGSLAAVRVRGELREYYRRKVGEGKRGLVVLNAVKNKMLRRVCACLRDWRRYEREYVGGGVAA